MSWSVHPRFRTPRRGQPEIRAVARLAALAVALSALVAGCGAGTAGVTLHAAQVVADPATSEARLSHYRFTELVAQTLRSSAMGVDVETEFDPARPALMAEISPESSHVVADVTEVVGLPTDDIDTIELELWFGQDRMVIDSSDYQSLVDATPTIQLGPLAPGLAYVDLSEVDSDETDLVAAVVGSRVPDLGDLTATLRDILLDVSETAGNAPKIYAGVTSYASFISALGTDPEVAALSVARGLALNTNIDPDALAALYVEFYSVTPVDVAVQLGADGLINVVTTVADFSGIYAHLFDPAHADALGITPDEAADLVAAFADTTWTIRTRLTYEPDENLVVPPAPPAGDDRTAIWAYFLAVGGA